MKIAVVGSGAAGLASTWALNEYSDHEVHLYEADDRIGGHANTVLLPARAGSEECHVDTAFIAFNRCTYPNFLRFLRLDPTIRILSTSMSFSVSRDNGFFEWSGKNIWSVFCQRKRLLDPSMWILLYDIIRFNVCARRLLDEPAELGLSIGEYLRKEGYSDSFRDNYLLPMTAGIWSTPPDAFAMTFPAQTLVQFMMNHQLLRVTGKSEWLTIAGGSQEYIKRIIEALPREQLHLSTPVQSLISIGDTAAPQILLTTVNGNKVFDRVIFACHSDAVLSILKAGGGVTDEEHQILSAFRWNENECVLHYDEALMPKNREAWSCWNYLAESSVDEYGKTRLNPPRLSIIPKEHLEVGMNALQHLSYAKHGPILVTLNPPYEPRPEMIIGRWKYDHPLLDANAKRSQVLLKRIQGVRSIYYAGAYLKYGFHEDGFTTGLEAAEAVAASCSSSLRLPFSIVRDGGQSPKAVSPMWYRIAALAFDTLEMSGIRQVVGTLLGSVMAAARWSFSFWADMRM
ncbi:uncharacterized protein EV420DRAFT_1635337 [Desarmillaria tabescens]|uniref:Amine oxidase domain-containing protein n=1 Tax=Armillaria tabescens TaxID=1929756 RepID=A0AA39NLX2_ARMTA|nr:uncharacterized protein EV420DRAFT_1635337 [Desarmillaria tabescens]KAK0468076.1 hypothetical protein EV420DRAFT_1635337 [Desarmillaria tabescens]